MYLLSNMAVLGIYVRFHRGISPFIVVVTFVRKLIGFETPFILVEAHLVVTYDFSKVAEICHGYDILR